MAETVTVTVNPGRSLLDGNGQHLPGDLVELPEKDAADLIARGIVSPAKQEQASDDGIIAKTGDLKAMTVPQLKKLCDKLEISYKSRAKEADLIALIEAHTAEPPKE